MSGDRDWATIMKGLPALATRLAHQVTGPAEAFGLENTVPFGIGSVAAAFELTAKSQPGEDKTFGIGSVAAAFELTAKSQPGEDKTLTPTRFRITLSVAIVERDDDG